MTRRPSSMKYLVGEWVGNACPAAPTGPAAFCRLRSAPLPSLPRRNLPLPSGARGREVWTLHSSRPAPFHRTQVGAGPALVTVAKLPEVLAVPAPGDAVLQGGVKVGLARERHPRAFLLDRTAGPLQDLSGI